MNVKVWVPEWGPVTGTVVARARRDGLPLADVYWTAEVTGQRWVTRGLPPSLADEYAADLRFNPGFDDVVVAPSN